jgi:putative heme-binding domain-containing protein
MSGIHLVGRALVLPHRCRWVLMLRSAGYLSFVILLSGFCFASLQSLLAQDNTTSVIESWADPKMPSSDGLQWWLDAGRLESAWSERNRNAIMEGQGIDVAYDASGHQRDAKQDRLDCFPKLKSVFGQKVLTFDGKDDFLRADIGLRNTKALTIFALAAVESNEGLFRCLLSGASRSTNDYITGLNVDLGAQPSARWDYFNIEGAGFSGARDFSDSDLEFGKFHLLEIVIDPEQHSVQLWIDGTSQKRMDRRTDPIQLDSLWLGSRYYSNDANAANVSGFLHGMIAEVAVYDRVLPVDQQKLVREYFQAKHLGLLSGVPQFAKVHPLQTLESTPAVQMLVPGFRVRQLPLQISNINNVRYRHDGTLIALGYNGNIYLLDDTDGDGLEDRARLYWENKGSLRGPIGMVVAPNGYSLGSGVIVASKGKLSFILDSNGDDVADREDIIAQGWVEITQNVDALGVALAKDESIYFGLGTTNYANGYLLDETGKAKYDIGSQRGTIVKVSPDWKAKESICTGVRFPVALDFNAEGELFATDQEGATWLSNGNPFDELLHIQKGKHYGFPPSHPRHLPDVVDEPSVFDYGPQHQSTCGLFFNRSVNGGASFGPDYWNGHALVCGESRGKLFRTELANSQSGYVARNAVIACLNQLTIDSCVSPDGSLIVACHSGPPDWGTGPQGIGSLYKIEYIAPNAPQPIAVWARGEREIAIAFDRELETDYLSRLRNAIKLERGKYNSAGDRFEKLVPPYAVVQRQRMSPRVDLPLYSVRVTADRRMLSLVTEPLDRDSNVSITLPAISEESEPLMHEVVQQPQIDLLCEPFGVEAVWTSADGKEEVRTVLPHLSLEISRGFTKGSIEHDLFFSKIESPGTLVLSSSLNLTHMLQPAVQVGASLDYTPKLEKVELNFELKSNANVNLVVEKSEKKLVYGSNRFQIEKATDRVPFQLTLVTNSKSADLDISFTTDRSSDPRPMALRRFVLPWLKDEITGSAITGSELAKLASEQVEVGMEGESRSGAWLNGQHLFFGAAQCSKCHRLRGMPGGISGPDLSNLMHRDDASILRDIRQPHAALNPDHLMVVVRTQGGEVVQGVPLASEDAQKLLLGVADGSRLDIDRSEIEELKASNQSLMPTGLLDALSKEQVDDLMLFLKTNPLQPASFVRKDIPAMRKWEDLTAIAPQEKLFGSPKLEKTMRVVLCDGPKDHGPDEHDYPAWRERWKKLLSCVEGLEVETASEWPSEEQLAKADLILFYSANPKWNESRGAELDRYLQRGGGLVFMHFAVNGQAAPEALATRIGLACDTSKLKFRHGELKLKLSKTHPLSVGLPDMDLVDESYWQMIGDAAQIDVVAAGEEEGAWQPLIWTVERGKGRVFATIMGHYSWTLDDPVYRVLLLRGMMWSAGRDPDSLLPLSTVGARLANFEEKSSAVAKNAEK